MRKNNTIVNMPPGFQNTSYFKLTLRPWWEEMLFMSKNSKATISNNRNHYLCVPRWIILQERGREMKSFMEATRSCGTSFIRPNDFGLPLLGVCHERGNKRDTKGIKRNQSASPQGIIWRRGGRARVMQRSAMGDIRIRWRERKTHWEKGADSISAIQTLPHQQLSNIP